MLTGWHAPCVSRLLSRNQGSVEPALRRHAHGHRLHGANPSPAAAAAGAGLDPKQPITAQVHDRLRHAIITLQLKPSEALSEKELSLKLGVSRTPVREALIRLADEGLVDILPQRGSFVAPIRMAEVKEAQFIRETLELAVVRRAAEEGDPSYVAALESNLREQWETAKARDFEQFLQLDEAFHRLISESCGLAKSWRLILTVKSQLDRVRYLSLPEPGHLRQVQIQHKLITRAIKMHDPDLAVRVMDKHLHGIFLWTEQFMREKPDLFL